MKRSKERIYLFLSLFLVFGAYSVAQAAKPYILSVQQLKDGLGNASHPSQKGFILVDVRTPMEHESGYIPGTNFNIDFREIQHRHRELEAKFEDHVVVYCQTGQRSNVAAETLMTLGYKNVYNVAGSMNAWQEAGYSVEFPNR